MDTMQGITAKQAAFIEEYAQSDNVSRAAAVAGVSRGTAYRQTDTKRATIATRVVIANNSVLQQQKKEGTMVGRPVLRSWRDIGRK